MSSKKISTSHYYIETQPNEITNFEALRELKEAQNHHSAIMNRIGVLKFHEERNIKKIQNQQNKIQKIKQIRDQSVKDKQKSLELKKSIVGSIQQQKALNKTLKEKQKQKLEEIKERIAENKVENYKDEQEKKQKNQRKIIRQKEEALIKKQTVRNQVTKMEESTKETILQFITKKNNTIHQTVLAERDAYMRKKNKKEKDIVKASMMEMKMLKKHSQSQVAYRETKNKLDTMLGNIRKQNRQNKEKLKSVMKDKSPETSFYEHMI